MRRNLGWSMYVEVLFIDKNDVGDDDSNSSSNNNNDNMICN